MYNITPPNVQIPLTIGHLIPVWNGKFTLVYHFLTIVYMLFFCGERMGRRDSDYFWSWGIDHSSGLRHVVNLDLGCFKLPLLRIPWPCGGSANLFLLWNLDLGMNPARVCITSLCFCRLPFDVCSFLRTVVQMSTISSISWFFFCAKIPLEWCDYPQQITYFDGTRGSTIQ